MKATYFWVRGPFQDREIVLQKAKRIEIGPPGEGRLEVPGCAAGGPWAVVDLDKARCYLTNMGAPMEISITRKERGQLTTTPVASGQRVETKANDVVSFGAEGPAVYCQYELEAQDMFGGSMADLPEAVSPLSAERRKQLVEAHSFARKSDLASIEKKAEAAEKTAGEIGGELKKEELRTNVGLIVVSVIAVVAIGVAGALYLALRRSESTTQDRFQMMVRALGGTKENDLEKNAEFVKESREEARKELERIKAEYEELKKTAKGKDEHLATMEEQMAAYALELNENKPLEKKFEAMRGIIDSSLFLISCYVRASKPIFADGAGNPTDWAGGTGTGFVVGKDGTMLTAKHVVAPWKFPEMAQILAAGDAEVAEVRIQAFPVGHRFPGDGTLGQSPYSKDNGLLEVVAYGPDEMAQYGGFVAESNWQNDIAVLRIKAPGAKPLQMVTEEQLDALSKKLVWPVMVAGFPLGPQVMENQAVAYSTTIGNVRKVERLIQHTAPTCGGNSGGPLIDERGRVVGIISYMLQGDRIQNMNAAVPVTLALRLMEKAKSAPKDEEGGGGEEE